jgi:hypothetical protein
MTERVKNRIRRGWYWFYTEDDIEAKIKELEENGGLAHIVETHGVPCSCYMCGNPRRYFKETSLQEKKFEDEFESQMEEILDE